MSNLHKSSDGKWRNCKAEVRSCPVQGGHVSDRSMFNATSALTSIGFGAKEFTKMSVQDIESLSNNFSQSRKDTPAYLLGNVKDAYVPPVGVILDLDRTPSLFTKRSKFTELMNDRNLSATIETERVFDHTENGKTEKRAHILITFEQDDPETGNRRSTTFEDDVAVQGDAPTISGLLERLVKTAPYGESPAREERLANVAGKNARARHSAKALVARGDTARSTLIDLFGENGYKKLVG